MQQSLGLISALYSVLVISVGRFFFGLINWAWPDWWEIQNVLLFTHYTTIGVALFAAYSYGNWRILSGKMAWSMSDLDVYQRALTTGFITSASILASWAAYDYMGYTDKYALATITYIVLGVLSILMLVWVRSSMDEKGDPLPQTTPATATAPEQKAADACIGAQGDFIRRTLQNSQRGY
jgi:hypothetical protein